MNKLHEQWTAPCVNFFAGLSIERLELTLTCYDPNLRILVKRLVL